MPHEPKKRHSKQRQGKRRASIHLAAKLGSICQNCGTTAAPHTICKQCGYYRGKQIIAVSEGKTTKTKQQTTS